jgi:Fe-S cluster assembly protein SufD
MAQVAQEKDIYIASFERAENDLAGKDPAWLRSIRHAAIACFADRGFPTTREEEWRFTNIAPIAKQPFQLATTATTDTSPDSFEALLFGKWECQELVIVNGRVSASLSSLCNLPKGVLVQGLGATLKQDPQRLEPYLARYASYKENSFVALNTAFMVDGAFVYIPDGVVVEKPIHLVYVSTANGEPIVSHPRSLIVAGMNSQARIIESYVGWDGHAYFTNAVTEVLAGENATIDHYKLQRESHQAFHVATVQVDQCRSSHFSTNSISLGGALVRNDINAVLGGEGGECTLNGLYVVTGHQHVDHHTLIDHAKPHCTSHELYKGVLDQHARGVFNGRIIVRPGAQKTDARQTNKNLLLSDEALVNTNPQLEIYADDVKCAHGATIGQLDADAVFYLRSRGIDREMARTLLTYAFVSEMTNQIKIDPIRTGLECTLFTSLPHGHALLEEI